MADIKVPVRADCEIIPDIGFTQVGPILCEPESISIRGPQILLHQVDELVTRHRRFLQVDEPIETRLSLRNVFSSKILLEAQNVLVRARIEPLGEIHCDSVLVEIQNLPQTMLSTVFPTTANIILEGPESSLDALDTMPARLFLDYNTDWNQEQSSYVPKLEGPPYLRVVAMVPPEVSWTIQETKMKNSKRR
jgi:hypothetical protein